MKNVLFIYNLQQQKGLNMFSKKPRRNHLQHGFSLHLSFTKPANARGQRQAAAAAAAVSAEFRDI